MECMNTTYKFYVGASRHNKILLDLPSLVEIGIHENHNLKATMVRFSQSVFNASMFPPVIITFHKQNRIYKRNETGVIPFGVTWA